MLEHRLRALREDVPPARDLWPDIVARLPPREAGAATPPPFRATRTPRPAETARSSRRARGRRNAGYAAAAVLVLAIAAGSQLLPGAGTPATPPDRSGANTVADAIPGADAPLLRAADALAREYQGALREIEAGAAMRSGTPAGPPRVDAAVAELDRSAAEVRAALARDPDALHLFHRLRHIYAQRLALTLREAPHEEFNA